MREYPSNSHRSKEQTQETEASREKKVEKVVTGKVKTKKNDVRRFTDVFISEDATNVKSYIFMDVIVPAIKKAILDIASDGVSMILYGDTRASKKNSGGVNKIAYRKYYDEPVSGNRSSTGARTRFDYDDIEFEARGEAEAVRTEMLDIIERYGFVTVADMYELAGLTAPFTAHKYGWSSLRSAETVRTRDGFILKMPKASPID